MPEKLEKPKNTTPSRLIYKIIKGIEASPMYKLTHDLRLHKKVCLST